MFKNYLMVFLRNIKKNVGYFLITTTSLLIGLTCFILLLIWIRNELSYDRFHDKAKDIYRVLIEDHIADGKTNTYAVAPTPLGPALKEEYPLVVNAVRYQKLGQMGVKYNDKAFMEREFAFVDPSFFEIFSFSILKGDKKKSLANPHAIVISEAMSMKYFGTLNAIDKTLNVNDQFDFVVTAVAENTPQNSHFTFDFLVPFSNIELFGKKVDDWGSVGTYTFLQLQKNHSKNEFSNRIRDYLKRREAASITTLRIQPLTDVHLHSSSITGMGGDGDIKFVYIFSTIAIFVLLIACINFINLSIAQSERRTKEIDMRKIAGATRKYLILQFLGESIALSLVALILAIVLAVILFPVYENLTGKELSSRMLEPGSFLIHLIGVALLTGIISGIYPAIYLSSFHPLKTLKGSWFGSQKGGPKFRKVLVVFQFTISIVFIVGTVLIYKQLDFIKKQNLGFDKDHLLYISLPANLSEKSKFIKNEFLKNKDVISVAGASDIPSRVRISTHGINWEGKNPESNVETKIMFVDDDYINTLNIEMDKGRFYSRNFQSDKDGAIVINQAAVKKMGLDSPVGKWLEFNEKKNTIIGVVKDFNFESLHKAVQPILLILSAEKITYLLIRLNSSGIYHTVEKIKEIWARATSMTPMDYGFIDETIDNLYNSDLRNGAILKNFTLLSIFISCLGLFGLASSVTSQRTKEIGIRKVLGASVMGIVTLISKEFTWWVVIANVFAWPIAYYFMNNWLQSFAYRIEIGMWVFILSGIISLLIAFAAVSYQSIKAAASNPIDSLKYE